MMSGAVVERLFEREAELARVGGLLDGVSRGAGAVAVVEGPAGIGKSGLLAAVGAVARARGFGVVVITAVLAGGCPTFCVRARGH
jgi:ABC-type cobalamin transport system ATPase subunit